MWNHGHEDPAIRVTRSVPMVVPTMFACSRVAVEPCASLKFAENFSTGTRRHSPPYSEVDTLINRPYGTVGKE